MGFLDALRAKDQSARIEGDGVYLREPVIDDFKQWRALRSESAEFLKPWEPDWQPEELTTISFRQRIRHYRELRLGDTGYPFFVFASHDDSLLGATTLHHLKRGVSQSATLGYWVGAVHARQNVMTRALAALLPYAHGELRLHRVEAACLPRNEASIRLLEKSGFEREGYAKSYLKIAGIWEDHILWSHRKAISQPQ
jgi:[ribosomal protein S5]-alanine N-acetyltransferase